MMSEFWVKLGGRHVEPASAAAAAAATTKEDAV